MLALTVRTEQENPLRKPSRMKLAAAIGGTAALVGASLMVATPAVAISPPVVLNFGYTETGDAGISPWGPGQLVPAGVHELTYTIQGGSGGDSESFWGGDGGNPALVTGTLPVVPGDNILIWAGVAGGDADNAEYLDAGDGGAGYNDGGDGATSGVAGSPGAGGGGSTAIQQNGSLVAHAGGGGGGGGRGPIGCSGGDGGDAASAVGITGDNASGPDACSSVQLGGAGGANPLSNGADATDVPNPGLLGPNPALGGSGGGGGGGGAAGTQNLSAGFDFSGGGGGGGGASLGDSISAPDPINDDGFISISYVVAYITETTAVVNPIPVAPGKNVTITATVENTEGTQDPLGTVDFNITGCEAQPRAAGTANDSLATATCTFVAGAPAVTVYDVEYNELEGSIFAPSATTATVDVKAMLAATGSGDNAPLLIGGSALLLLIGGAFVAVRRVRVA